MNKYVELKNKAQTLRKKGNSFSEISIKLNIAKSTASLWTRNVKLNKLAVKRLKNNSDSGREKSLQIRKLKHKEIQQSNLLYAKKVVKKANINTETVQIFCALLYWGEGSKLDRCLRFTNSDPKMINTFLRLLRKSFPDIDEKKFRCVLQIHEYHNEKIELNYWSNITKIPTSQFTKSYLKPHTGTIEREGYHGTIGIKYYDTNVVDRLIAIYNTLSDIGV
jgi:hypothetical protein